MYSRSGHLAFIDFLFILLLVFISMFILALLLINPIPKKSEIEKLWRGPPEGFKKLAEYALQDSVLAMNLYTKLNLIDKYVALAKVLEISRNVDIPVIGIGGIIDWKDVVEFMIVGASAIQIGTLNFIDPSAAGKIIIQLEEYCFKMGIEKISELTASYNI